VARLIQIDSANSVERCKALLLAALRPFDLEGRLDLGSTRHYVGEIQDETVRIRPVGPAMLNGRQIWHPWTPGFRGRLIPIASRTRLEGHVSLNPAIVWFGLFMTVILGGWLAAGLSTLGTRLGSGESSPAGYGFGGILLPIAFGSALATLYLIGYRLFRRDRDELIAFLEETLHGL
jgi:hypothetical protein